MADGQGNEGSMFCCAVRIL